jgi:hypothetical protein
MQPFSACSIKGFLPEKAQLHSFINLGHADFSVELRFVGISSEDMKKGLIFLDTSHKLRIPPKSSPLIFTYPAFKLPEVPDQDKPSLILNRKNAALSIHCSQFDMRCHDLVVIFMGLRRVHSLIAPLHPYSTGRAKKKYPTHLTIKCFNNA